MSQAMPPTTANASRPGSLGNGYPTTSQCPTDTSQYSGEWFCLQDDESTLPYEKISEDSSDSSQSGLAGNDTELIISADFHVDDHNVVDPN